MNIGEGISGAVFNGPDCRHRYALWRIWDPDKDFLLFIGLNPSTANEHKDDPTIRCLIGFAKVWGYGGLFAGNLFSQVTAYPKELIRQSDSSNDEAILKMRNMTTMVLVGWGNEGHGARPGEVLKLLEGQVFCLRTTKLGEPSHPLYFAKTSLPTLYLRKAA